VTYFGRASGGIHRRLQAILFHRFEQVVDGVGFEGFERVVGKRGSENDRRRFVELGDMPRRLDAVHARHADIEQHDIGLQAPGDRAPVFHRRLSVSSLSLRLGNG
jgi:hypothetical protein